ncbi:unnamed protein product [Closterium sp. NIES-65]|nr:unnamed protein product [Closterium sp. NIES-65]
MLGGSVTQNSSRAFPESGGNAPWCAHWEGKGGGWGREVEGGLKGVSRVDSTSHLFPSDPFPFLLFIRPVPSPSHLIWPPPFPPFFLPPSRPPTRPPHEQWKQAGMWVAGAAAAAVGVQVSAQVLEALDKVPFLADLEVLVGTGVALNFLSSYVRGGPARARVQASIDSIVDAIKGFDSPTDSDLQLQLQQLVADTTVVATPSLASASTSSASISPSSFSSASSSSSSSPSSPSFAARIAGTGLFKARGGQSAKEVGRQARPAELTFGGIREEGERAEEGEEVVLVKKQSLISRLVDFVRGKEVKTKRATLALQAEAARSQALQSRAADLNQSLQASKRAAQAAAQKLEELRAANGRLQAERSESRAAMGGLQQEVASLSAALGSLTADTDALKQSKEKLASKVQSAITENQSLAASLASAKSRQQQQVAAAEAMRAQLRADEATLGKP